MLARLRHNVGFILVRTVGFALLWWVIAEGRVDSLAFGVVMAALAAAASAPLHASQPWRVHPFAALRLAAFLLFHSLAGGLDVARRALHPRLPLNPTMFDVRLRLPHPGARILAANLISLLPGTLSVDLGQETLTMHVLDASAPNEQRLRALEQRLGAAFGWTLQEL